ncbi:MAG: MltA domain-containing protein [Thermodesulfobacteriota bacterium]|nr:MltA domain-containing protein [Thermodesulfobacteriota bacterium]
MKYHNLKITGGLCLFLVFVFLAGCAKEVSKPHFRAVSSWTGRRLSQGLDPSNQKLRSWTDLEESLLRSMSFVESKPKDALAVRSGNPALTWGRVHESLARLLSLLPRLDKEPGLLAENFTWFEVTPRPLMTGYYLPYLEADLEQGPDYPYPIYGMPPEMKSLELERFHHRWEGWKLQYRLEDGEAVPYFDRNAIDFQEALKGRNLELAWTGDLTELFFLHIQGSGLLHFPDGTTRYALYAGKNGHPYVSLGRVLIEQGHLAREDVSMRSIREFLAQNPEQREELFSQNPSYVFFKLGDEGPFGAMGRLLTPMVSMAVDPRFLPLGSVLVFKSTLPPAAPGLEETEITGISLAQDTGGAIQGNRLDYYCGAGPQVEYMAGNIKARTRAYLLIVREAP